MTQLVNRVLSLGTLVGIIEHSPRGWLPKKPKAESLAKEWLLPNEQAKLLAGVNAGGAVVVPLNYRAAAPWGLTGLAPTNA